MITRPLRIAIACANLALAPLVGHAQALPHSVTQALKAANIPQANTAVFVQEIGARSPRISLNSEAALNPASVMKLVTTSAALDLLGPAYTWRTEAWSDAPLENGVLKGNLTLKGNGDPKLTFERFWLLLRELRASGVREIRGDLVLDRSAFAALADTPIDDQVLRPYNVTPDALLLNFKSIRLRLKPDTQRKELSVQAEPQPANVEIISRIELGNAACTEWKDDLRADVIEHPASDGARYRLILTGSFNADCGIRDWRLGLLSHPQYIAGVFRQLWAELGGTISGTVQEGKVSTNMRLLAQSESPPLLDIVRDINKFSNNVMARQLLLSLAVANGRNSARPEDGAETIRSWLASKNIAMPELVMENGSGLSRKERISAQSLARLLGAVWKSPLMPEFVSSLPLNAVDGTMKKRLKNGDIAGRTHLKTGTLEGVKTLAGYVLDANGKWWIVVFMVNHPKAASAQAAQDALVQWVYEH